MTGDFSFTCSLTEGAAVPQGRIGAGGDWRLLFYLLFG